MRKIVSLLCLLLFTGCSSLIPKRVELGQDKVQKFPVEKAAEAETRRQTAQRAAEKVEQVVLAAIEEDCSQEVIAPAQEAKVLSEAVARSLGPPLKPAPIGVNSDELAQKLDTAVAKQNRRVEDFKAENNENAGKKIEGTGFLQVPYFVWLGGALVVGFIGLIVLGVAWSFLKMYALSNPPVALGVKAVQTGGKLAATSVSQLIAGGEKFKGWLQTEVPEISQDVRSKIKDLFRSAHMEAQDETVQNLVKELTPQPRK